MLTVSTALDSAASPVLLEAASGGVPIPPVRIEDGQGALIGTIAPRAQFDAMAVDSVPAGYQAVTWDQRDDAGAPVHAGVYFYRLHTDVFRDRRKMTLLP